MDALSRLSATFLLITLASMLAMLIRPSNSFAATPPITLSEPDHHSSRPQIAAEGKHVYVVWEHHYYTGDGWTQDVLFKKSSDKGASFHDTINLSFIPQASPSLYQNSTQPNIAASGPNVFVVWYEAIPYQSHRIHFAYSTDYGASFSPPSAIGYCPWGDARPAPYVSASGNTMHVIWTQETPCGDTDPRNGNYIHYAKVTIGIDSIASIDWRGLSNNQGFLPQIPCYHGERFITSTGNNVYATWKHPYWYNPSTPIVFAKSTDNGESFNLSELNFPSPATPTPIITAWGSNVHLAWRNNGNIMLASSANGGDNFNAAGFTPRNLTSDLGITLLLDMVVNGNELYLIGVKDPGSPNPTQFHFWKSTDNGATFTVDAQLSGPIPTNPDKFNLAVADNHVHVAWDEIINNITGNRFDVVHRSSSDGGANFGSRIDISGTPSQISYQPRLAASADNAYVVWIESVTDQPDRIMFSRITDIVDQPRVVVLLDRSGSMSSRHDGTPATNPDEQRIALARRSAKFFLELLERYGSHQAEIGLATFPQQPWLPFQCNGQIVSPMTLVDSTSITNAKSALDALQPDGMTPLIAGIRTAQSMLGVQTNEAIVLLSDGYHNCPRSFGDIYGNLLEQLTANGTRVFTVGFGGGSYEVDLGVLETLASTTTPAGYTQSQFYDVTAEPFDPATFNPATALNGTYKNILADALGLAVGTEPLGTIQAGKEKTFPIAINEHDRKISFILSWAKPKAARLNLSVLASDGEPVPTNAAGVTYRSTDTYQILTVDEPFLSQPGKVSSTPWQLVITASTLDGDAQAAYQYGVLMNSELKMKVALDKATYVTGDTITLSAAITEAGQPVLNLKDVYFEVTRPDEGLGNWLVKNKITAAELAKAPTKLAAETLTLRQRIGHYLTKIRKVALPTHTRPGQLRLFDDGSHGDKSAGDGIYTNQFSTTEKEGTYSFSVHASGPTQNKNRFVREDLIQKHIKLNLTPETITLEMAPPSEPKRGQVQRTVTILPKDAMGNYLGPGYADSIRLTSTKGNFDGKVQDNLDGSYQQNLTSHASIEIRKADIQVELRHQIRPVAPPTQEAAVKPEPGFPRWMIMLLLILALAVLAYLIFWLLRRTR
jgi:Mg-chelatase subunit ChlD